MPGKSLTVLGNEGSGKKTLVAYLSFTVFPPDPSSFSIQASAKSQ
ncbi:hypothetical protein BFJ70_g16606 [Fusarium oxysporum]|nr:hypothetical protein FOMA001_g19824 [Fusarium oxysporum f. sp. matthiolae]RKL09839.1 hypothetical protein BFJ70_g16606 [Fusarium oxysporum]